MHVIKIRTGRPKNHDEQGHFARAHVLEIRTSLLTIPIGHASAEQIETEGGAWKTEGNHDTNRRAPKEQKHPQFGDCMEGKGGVPKSWSHRLGTDSGSFFS